MLRVLKIIVTSKQYLNVAGFTMMWTGFFYGVGNE